MAKCVSVMTKILRKRHDLRTHKQKAVSDWLNPLSLGSMSASGHIANLAKTRDLQTWGESTFNDTESDSGRLFDSESESDSSQFGYDSESDSSNISISDSNSESDSNFQLLI